MEHILYFIHREKITRPDPIICLMEIVSRLSKGRYWPLIPMLAGLNLLLVGLFVSFHPIPMEGMTFSVFYMVVPGVMLLFWGSALVWFVFHRYGL